MDIQRTHLFIHPVRERVSLDQDPPVIRAAHREGRVALSCPRGYLCSYSIHVSTVVVLTPSWLSFNTNLSLLCASIHKKSFGDLVHPFQLFWLSFPCQEKNSSRSPFHLLWLEITKDEHKNNQHGALKTNWKKVCGSSSRYRQHLPPKFDRLLLPPNEQWCLHKITARSNDGNLNLCESNHYDPDPSLIFGSTRPNMMWFNINAVCVTSGECHDKDESRPDVVKSIAKSKRQHNCWSNTIQFVLFSNWASLVFFVQNTTTAALDTNVSCLQRSAINRNYWSLC